MTIGPVLAVVLAAGVWCGAARADTGAAVDNSAAVGVLLPGVNLASLHIDDAVVYYEPCFADQMPAFQEFYKTVRVGSHPMLKLFEDRQEQIAQDLADIIGDPEIVSQQKDLLKKMTTGFAQAFNLPTSVIILQQQTCKRILRQGGRLPGFSYDKKTDRASYEVQLWASSESSSPSDAPLIIPASGPETLLDMAATILTPFRENGESIDKFYGISVHEMTEMCLLKSLRLHHPHFRWFSEGCANSIAFHILKTRFNEKAARAFMDSYATEKYQDIQRECNLQYWMLLNYGFGNTIPLEKEELLNHARYCFATAEIQRLVEQKDIMVLSEIIRRFKAQDRRSPETLYAVIRDITGEDLQLRMRQEYQTFSDRQKGLERYQHNSQKAQQGNDLPGQIYPLLRMLEIQENPFKQENALLRKQIAILFCRIGQPETGDEGMRNLVELCRQVEDSAAEPTGLELFVQYALEADRPAIAVDAAKALLKTVPDHAGAKQVLKLSENQSGSEAVQTEVQKIPAAGEASGKGDVEQLLKRKVDFSAVMAEMTVEEAIDLIRRSAAPPLPIVVLWNDLAQNALIEKDTPVGVDGLGVVPLETGLRAIVRAMSVETPVDFVAEGGVITIASRRLLLKTPGTGVYEVGDLNAPRSEPYPTQ